MEAEVFSLIDDSHTAATQLLSDAVVRDHLPDHWAEILGVPAMQVNQVQTSQRDAKSGLAWNQSHRIDTSLASPRNPSAVLLCRLQLVGELIDGHYVVIVREIGVAGQSIAVLAIHENFNPPNAGRVCRDGVDQRSDGQFLD